MKDFLKRLPRMICDKRKKLSLSQEKLAEMVGVSTSSIGQIERCETLPSVQTLYSIVQCLNLNVHSLFFGEVDPSSEIDELCNLAQQMDASKRRQLVDFARYLHEYQSRDPK